MRFSGAWLSTCLIMLFSVSPAHAETKLKIVSSLPLTGSANQQSVGIANGVRMAVDEAASTLGDVSLSYEVWDDSSPARGAWDPAVEASNADKAVQDQNVVAYIGPYNSGAAKISMPKLNSAGLLMVSPSASWPGLTKPGIGEPNEPAVYRPSGSVTFLRIVPADDIQGSVGAAWAKELGAKKIYVLHDGELYGKGVASIFKSSAEKLELNVLGFDKVDAKATNYRSVAVKIKQLQPDLIYYGGTTQTNAGQLAKDLKAAGVQAKLMVPDGCYENAFIESAGKEALEGNVFITFGGVPANLLLGKGKDFYERYKKTFSAEPQGYSVYGYESASVVIEAIRNAATKDRAGILRTALTTKDFEGALGKWTLDANGDTSLKTMSGLIVQNGEFKLSKILG